MACSDRPETKMIGSLDLALKQPSALDPIGAAGQTHIDHGQIRGIELGQQKPAAALRTGPRTS
jgi:hypothetical protein